MATTTLTTEDSVKSILSEACKDIKGRYYVYERYKLRLQNVCTTSSEYERACIELARCLRI